MRRAFLTWATGLLVLSGCNPNGTVEIFLLKSTNERLDPLDPALVSHIRIHVKGKDMHPREKTFEFVPGGALKLPDIPVGEDRVITVEGLRNADDEHPLSRGRTLPMRISRGHNEIELFIARVRSFSYAPDEDRGLSQGRFAHSAIISDRGSLFIAGGAQSGTFDTPSKMLSSIEVLDPVSGMTKFLACDKNDVKFCLYSPRALAAAAPVEDGFLLLGGMGENGLLDTVELVDTGIENAEEQSFRAVARTHASSVILEDTTLIAGGRDASGNPLDTIEIVDREANISSSALPSPRWGMAAAKALDNGFFFGGWDEMGAVTNDAFLINPIGGVIAEISTAVAPRAFAAAVTLPDDKILVIGGLGEDGKASSVDLFDPRRSLLCNVGHLETARWHTAAVSLRDGRVLVIGGLVGNGEVTSTSRMLDARYIELGEDCDDPISGRLDDGVGAPTVFRRYHSTAVQMENEIVVVAGGLDQDDEPITQIEIYIPDE
jgi:hypothetical protein